MFDSIDEVLERTAKAIEERNFLDLVAIYSTVDEHYQGGNGQLSLRLLLAELVDFLGEVNEEHC